MNPILLFSISLLEQHFILDKTIYYSEFNCRRSHSILSAVSGIFHKQTYTCGVCNRFKYGVCLNYLNCFPDNLLSMFSRQPNRINQVTPKKGTPFTTTKNRRKKGRIDNIRTKAGRASLLHFCFWRGKFTVGSWCYSSEDKKQNTIYCKYIIQSLTASACTSCLLVA